MPGCERHYSFCAGSKGDYTVCQPCGDDAREAYDFAEVEDRFVRTYGLGERVSNVMLVCHQWDDNCWEAANERWDADQRSTRSREVASVQSEWLDDYVKHQKDAAQHLRSLDLLEQCTMDLFCLRAAIELC